MKTALMAETSPESLVHIMRCLEHYPNFCEFYVTGASVFRHHVLIDLTHYLTEDYIYTRENNTILPDCLYVDDIDQNPKIRAFAKAFEAYIDQLPLNHKHRLTKEEKIKENNIEKIIKKHDVKEYLTEAKSHLEKEMFKIAHVMNELKNARYKPYNYESGKIPESVQTSIKHQVNRINIMTEILKEIKKKAVRVISKAIPEKT